jgi:hypothetical protein
MNGASKSHFLCQQGHIHRIPSSAHTYDQEVHIDCMKCYITIRDKQKLLHSFYLLNCRQLSKVSNVLFAHSKLVFI